MIDLRGNPRRRLCNCRTSLGARSSEGIRAPVARRPLLIERRAQFARGDGSRDDGGVRARSICIVVASVGIAVAAAPLPSPELLKRGRDVYEGSDAGCSACHGVTGEGNGPVAFAIKPPPRNFTKDPFKDGDSVEQIFATITNGLPNTRMVGYPQLAEGDRWALAYYVRAFRPRVSGR